MKHRTHSFFQSDADLFTRQTRAAAGSRRLPGGLLVDSARRLGLMAFISVITSLSFFGLSELIGVYRGEAASLKYTVFPCFLALSLVVLFAAKSRRLAPETILDIGLVYKVLAAICLAILVNRQPWPEMVTLPSWSPIAVWVLIFSLIVPDSPWRILWSSAAAAAADPLSVFVLARFEFITLPATEVMVHRFLPNVIAVMVGVMVAKIIAHIGNRLARARRMGRYQLTELLGKGGMGEVWRGQHQLLARAAAVKLIRTDYLGGRGQEEAERTLRRFEREVKATAALRSPHTIVVYDYGIDRAGTFYYVMELLDGMDLDSFVAKYGPQPAGRVVRILRQACHSLYEAHLAGLVHRDVKPANLFLCRYGIEVDFVKILDFGLVRDAGTSRREGEADFTLTRQDSPPAPRPSWRRRWCWAIDGPTGGPTSTPWAAWRTGCSPANTSSRPTR
ncbi:MAG: serine/threonine-protein kinase [bacterium]